MFDRQLSRHGRRFARFMHQPRADQKLVLRVFYELGRSRFIIRTRGMKTIEPQLGLERVESTKELTPAQADFACRLQWALKNVRMYTPWHSDCFPQAVTAYRLLNKRSIPATIYFGATKHAHEDAGAAVSGEFAAHVWVRAGATSVSGGDVQAHYTPIVWYSLIGVPAMRQPDNLTNPD